jgi:hypothetical protein
MTVAKEITKYKLDLVGIYRSDVTEMALNQQANLHFSVERRVRIMN